MPHYCAADLRARRAQVLPSGPHGFAQVRAMQPQGPLSETHLVCQRSWSPLRLVELLESSGSTALAAPRTSWRTSVAVMQLGQEATICTCISM